jgi:hypothetical protein
MYKQVEKPKESAAVANSVAQKKNANPRGTEILYNRQGFGFVDNRPEAIEQRKVSATMQLMPSDFLKFANHQQFNLSPLKMLQSTSWNAFVLHSSPYFKIADENEDQQKSWMNAWYGIVKSLFNDPEADFSKKQKETAASVVGLLGQEKGRLFKGGSAISSGDFTIKADDPKPKGSHEYGSIIHDPYFGELWPSDPAIEDVRQGGIGDCYLLAAIASVVKTKPEHFISHMVDNLDGTVTVKMYENDGTPVNISINKSVVGEHYAEGALWVKLLEKAYAAAGYSGSAVLPERMNKASYENIEGGSGGVALTHLTGAKTTDFSIGKGRGQVEAAIFDKTRARQDELRDQLRLLDESIKTKKKLNQDVKKEELLYSQVYEQFANIQIRIGELGTKLSLNYVSTEDIEQFLLTLKGDVKLIAAIRKAVGLDDKVPLLPGKLGSNRYGKDDLALYEKIKANIDTGQILTVSTKNTIEDSENEAEEERGHSAGEAKVKGLASKHAYSVLDYTPKVLEPDTPIRVKIRNPWGHYGRAYEPDLGGGLKSTTIAKGDGVFWIDIADMVSFFSRLSMTIT